MENEWDRDPETEELEDLLYVTYDAGKITMQEILSEVEAEGFEAELKKED